MGSQPACFASKDWWRIVWNTRPTNKHVWLFWQLDCNPYQGTNSCDSWKVRFDILLGVTLGFYVSNHILAEDVVWICNLQGRGQLLFPRCFAVALVSLLSGAAEGLRNFAFNMYLGSVTHHPGSRHPVLQDLKDTLVIWRWTLLLRFWHIWYTHIIIIWIQKDMSPLWREISPLQNLGTCEGRHRLGDLSRLRSRLVARLRQDAFAVLMSQDRGFVGLSI